MAEPLKPCSSNGSNTKRKSVVGRALSRMSRCAVIGLSYVFTWEFAVRLWKVLGNGGVD